jgi:hypothetical protein
MGVLLKWDRARWEDLCRRWWAGETYTSIAADYGVCAAGIYTRVRKIKLTRDPADGHAPFPIATDATVSAARSKQLPTLARQSIGNEYVIESVTRTVVDRASLAGNGMELRYVNISVARLKFLERA